jgi:Family of unknown function (DUF6516)
MKAKEYANQKIKLPDGSLVSIVIWELPERTEERPHGFKYRLSYCSTDSTPLIRYDNEKGKGDHKHPSKGKEEPYRFQDIDTLLDDFWRDVDKILEKKEHE